MGIFYHFPDDERVARSTRKAAAFPHLYGTRVDFSEPQQAAWRAMWAAYVNGEREMPHEREIVTATRPSETPS